MMFIMLNSMYAYRCLYSFVYYISFTKMTFTLILDTKTACRFYDFFGITDSKHSIHVRAAPSRS
jgi:hypothetical protein